MPEVTFNQAKEFLQNISKKDKVAIIHHDDGDGFCSGILYYDWCKKQGAEVEQFTYSIRETKLKDFDLKDFNKIIICDLAPDFMSPQLEQIIDKQILYLDHHPREIPLPKEVLEYVTVDRGYIPASRTAGELTGLKPWVSLIGTITDMGHYYPENEEFIEKRLKEINMSLEDFQQKVTSTTTNFLVYFNKKPQKAFETLEKLKTVEEISKLKKYSKPVEKEIQKFVQDYEKKKEKIGDINFYYFNPKLSVKTSVSDIISEKDRDEIYIFASPKNNGKNITLKARNTSKRRNMATLLKAGMRGLDFGSAGGHIPAAGGMILAKDIDKFKENIRAFITN